MRLRDPPHSCFQCVALQHGVQNQPVAKIYLPPSDWGQCLHLSGSPWFLALEKVLASSTVPYVRRIDKVNCHLSWFLTRSSQLALPTPSGIALIISFLDHPDAQSLPPTAPSIDLGPGVTLSAVVGPSLPYQRLDALEAGGGFHGLSTSSSQADWASRSRYHCVASQQHIHTLSPSLQFTCFFILTSIVDQI